MNKTSAHDLHTFMAQVTNEMASEYIRIYARAVEDPGTAGDQGEENWATLFRDWLPPTYHVATKGRLIAHDGSMSPQVDVVVLKPAYPRKLREKRVWLAGGVAAAFECKTTITATHVTAAVESCTRFKALCQPRVGSPRKELHSPLIYGLLGHSHLWKGKRANPVGNIERALKRDRSSTSHPQLELDVLCVADLATWSCTYLTYEAAWNQLEQRRLEGIFGGPCGPVSAMVCSAFNSDNQQPVFRPVGALIGRLSQRLAWEDPSIRDIASYYRSAHLWGAAKGQMYFWPLSIYSDEVHAQLLAGERGSGMSWDEWSVSGI